MADDQEAPSAFDDLRKDMISRRGGDSPATLDDLFLAFDMFFEDAASDDPDDDEDDEEEDDEEDMVEAVAIHGNKLSQGWAALAVKACAAAGWIDSTGNPTSAMDSQAVEVLRQLQGETREFMKEYERVMK